ncbi:MAG TPA: NPCBM/NEW2 domain-containing protein, partial [Burkholderiaceae bacterium]
GWYFDAADRQGSVHVKTGKQDIRQALGFKLRGLQSAPAQDDDFPSAPALGPELPADAITVVARPAEEPGAPLENAFDGKPETWFRTTRNQAIKAGPHEWVLGFAERRLIAGLQLAPRNDQHWKYGQVRDYEVYLADNMGDWGAPVQRGRLKLQQGAQRIEFAQPQAGRLLRFRVLSVQNPDGDDGKSVDPMVTAAQAAAPARAFDAAQPMEVGPIALSEFRVLEHRPTQRPESQRYLSDLGLPASIARDKPKSSAKEMRMNGLLFRKGLGMGSSGRIDIAIKGDWHLLRADLGVDDSCRAAGGLQFQVWSGARLLYDSGLVQAPAVVKPEIDVRGLTRLSLRTLGARGHQPAAVCGNWANAVLIGMEGDSAAIQH